MLKSFVIFNVTFISLHIDTMTCVQNSAYLGIYKQSYTPENHAT